jgi:hypothetical protein
LLLLLLLLLMMMISVMSLAQSPEIIKYTSSRLVRVLFAWAPRIMRLFKLKLPKMGLVLQVG